MHTGMTQVWIRYILMQNSILLDEEAIRLGCYLYIYVTEILSNLVSEEKIHI